MMKVCIARSDGLICKRFPNPNLRGVTWWSFFDTLGIEHDVAVIGPSEFGLLEDAFVFLCLDDWNLWKDESIVLLLKRKKHGVRYIGWSNLFEHHLYFDPTNVGLFLSKFDRVLDGFLSFVKTDLFPDIPNFEGLLLANLQLKSFTIEKPKVATLANVARIYDFPIEAMSVVSSLGYDIICFSFEEQLKQFSPIVSRFDSVSLFPHVDEKTHSEFLSKDVGLVFQVFGGKCLGSIVPKCLEWGIPCFSHMSVWQTQLFPEWVVHSPHEIHANFEEYIVSGKWVDVMNEGRKRFLSDFTLKNNFGSVLDVFNEMRRTL